MTIGQLRNDKKEAIKIARLKVKAAGRGAAPVPGQAPPPAAAAGLVDKAKGRGGTSLFCFSNNTLLFFVLKRSFAQGLHLKDDTPIPSASDSHQLAHVVKTVPAMLSSCDPNVAFFLRRLNL